MSKQKKVKGVNYGVYCGHRFYPNGGSGPIQDKRTPQEIEEFIKKQRLINNTK